MKKNNYFENSRKYPKFRCQNCGFILQLHFDPFKRDPKSKSPKLKSSVPIRNYYKLKFIVCPKCKKPILGMKSRQADND